jgi:hypothetical protein
MDVQKSDMKLVIAARHGRYRKMEQTRLRHVAERSISRANAEVLGPEEKAAYSGGIPVAQHVLRGVVTQPAQVQEAFWYHNAKVASPVVGPKEADSPPWLPLPQTTSPVDDPYSLCPRGKETNLENRLTLSVFQQCLRSLSDGKAAGRDGLPNELLKSLPAAHKLALFAFFRLSWRTGRTPESWKASDTLQFYKKGKISDPANYRPIGIHACIYKLWTKIITTILSGYARYSL